ncbi:hypothetical protein OIU35_19105 [Boseaceae bacterium BT-24-1]|nr:hypothetical protein [Boseaceae bacterium BT-24-1]
MTSISAFAAGAHSFVRNTSDLLTLKGQLDVLTNQLSTGRVAETYGELGIRRSESLSARATLSAIGGYEAAIASARPRVELASASLAQVSKLAATLQGGLTNQTNLGGPLTKLARDSLDGVLAALNQQIGGQFLFSGRATHIAPVPSTDVLLNGDTSDPARPLAGLRTLVAEQTKADLGVGLGRLRLANPTSTSVGLQDEANAGARANFGFAIAAAPTASSDFAVISYSPSPLEGAVPSFSRAPTADDHFRVVVNQPAGGQKTYDLTGSDLADISSPANAASSLMARIDGGKIASVQSEASLGLTASFTNTTPPASLTINVASQPARGDQISIALALRDGSTTTLTLQAQANARPDSTTEFMIGPTPAATAQNLSDTLRRALGRAAQTALAASSTIRATQNFFAGSSIPGLAPRRIDMMGSPPHFSQIASASTVTWYQGEVSTTDPRASVTARTGATSAVAVGARANEDAIRAALSGLAAVAVHETQVTDTASDRWKALAQRAASLFPSRDALEVISTEFSLASSSLSQAQTHNQSTQTILQLYLDGIETVSREAVIPKILEVQNRIQASYQLTAMLSKLYLINYLR